MSRGIRCEADTALAIRTDLGEAELRHLARREMREEMKASKFSDSQIAFVSVSGAPVPRGSGFRASLGLGDGRSGEEAARSVRIRKRYSGPR
jgi:hypothetical protein